MLKMNRLQLFENLSRTEDGSYRFVSVEEFVGEYASLCFGNGSTWCRTSNIASKWRIITVKSNGTVNFPGWQPSDEELKDIDSLVSNNCSIKIKRGNPISYIKIYSENLENTNRPISKKIRDHFKNIPCCVCGSFSNLVVDHKNDLYNDSRVLDINTQTIHDFQSLCNPCNLLKRQICKKTLESKKRYKATNIPQLKCFDIDFIHGDESFDPKDINALRGTYWYDPVYFIKQAKILMITKNLAFQKQRLLERYKLSQT